MRGPDKEGGAPSGSDRARGRLLRARFWVYGFIIGVLLAFRVVPGLVSRWKASHRHPAAAPTLILAGLDVAPVLIPRLVDGYRILYPNVQFRLLNGGTRQALEDLFNLRADVAFTCRPMTREEEAVVHAAGDTALSFPIALGGIAVLASTRAPIDSIRVEDLRAVLRGVHPPPVRLGGPGPVRIYAADPNLGLWTALMSQLGLPDSTGAPVIWLAGDFEVVEALGADSSAIGFASTLALPDDLARRGVRAIDVRGERSGEAAPLTEGAVAVGDYPLYHYLYVSCRPEGGPLASGFVSFLHSGRGQHLVEREGFLPARSVPREIELVRKPIGAGG